MEFVIGFLIGASLGGLFGIVAGGITRTTKQADIIDANLRSAQHEREREPELPLAARRIRRIRTLASEHARIGRVV
jgi:hypothetical protein